MTWRKRLAAEAAMDGREPTFAAGGSMKSAIYGSMTLLFFTFIHMPAADAFQAAWAAAGKTKSLEADDPGMPWGGAGKNRGHNNIYNERLTCCVGLCKGGWGDPR